MIITQPDFSSWVWEANQKPGTGYIRRKHPEPVWILGRVSMPKRKYLMGHAHPFLLLTGTADVVLVDRKSVWEFRIQDRGLYEEFSRMLRDDPDMRRARRVPVPAPEE